MVRLLGLLFLVLQVTACDKPEGVFAESDGKVRKVEFLTGNQILKVACFVELADGAYLFPTVLYYQKHKTLVGVRDVEKPARIWTVLSKNRGLMSLPQSPGISKYHLLVAELPGTSGMEWNDWSGAKLVSFSADEVSTNQTLEIPSFAKIPDVAGNKSSAGILDKLLNKYEAIICAATNASERPVQQGDEIPWYAW